MKEDFGEHNTEQEIEDAIKTAAMKAISEGKSEFIAHQTEAVKATQLEKIQDFVEKQAEVNRGLALQQTLKLTESAKNILPILLKEQDNPKVAEFIGILGAIDSLNKARAEAYEEVAKKAEEINPVNPRVN